MATEGITLPDVPVRGAGTQRAGHARSRSAMVAGPLTHIQRRPWVRGTVVDAAVFLIAVLDVWLVIPQEAPPYSVYLSAASCVALLLRRRFPFTVLVLTVPGFLAGWAQVAAMLALGFLATRKQLHWQVWTGAALVWLCRFFLWPLPDFLALSWREHLLDVIYGVIVAGMPVAIGLLIGARTELAARLAELAESRDRERKLHAEMVRADERARLAREMHDVVSHDITLIAMQAGALSTAATPEDAARTARTIRQLSTNTLEELRALVGVLRSGSCADGLGDGPQPKLDEVADLVRASGVPAQLTLGCVPADLPPEVSAAAYRTVQEALTNVRKHAPGATACVHVTAEDDRLLVRVSNDRPRRTPSRLPSGGFGLTGLMERARLLGGTLDARPTEDGGFLVVASYPLAR